MKSERGRREKRRRREKKGEEGRSGGESAWTSARGAPSSAVGARIGAGHAPSVGRAVPSAANRRRSIEVTGTAAPAVCGSGTGGGARPGPPPVPVTGEGQKGRPDQPLPISFHSLLAAFSSSAISSRNALAVILPSSSFWNSGSLSALLMLFQSGR